MSVRTLVVVLCSLALSRSRLSAQQLSAGDRAELVARVWSEARYNFASWDHVRADWDSALGATLRLAAPAQSDFSFWRRLRRLAALLGDLQTTVVAPAALRSRLARPPLALISVEGRPFLADYAENDEMHVARPERLAEIIAVQGIRAEDWIRDSIMPEVGGVNYAARWERAVAIMLQGERGTLLHLTLKLPGGEERGMSVTRSVSLNERWPLDRAPLIVDTLPDGIVVVRVNSFGPDDVVEQFDRALPSFANVQGVILDLRRASGGRPAYGYEILARLTQQPFPAVLHLTPLYRPALRVLGPTDSAMTLRAFPLDSVTPRRDRPTFNGPIAALSSEATVGAAEDVLAAFRNTGRGVIIGATSAGSPGEVADLPLFKNWSLRLSVVREAFPDGTDFSGAGIAPELAVQARVEDLLAGRDAALDRARSYLAVQRD
jgi:C-terminal processing protease CtpA/Prc